MSSSPIDLHSDSLDEDKSEELISSSSDSSQIDGNFSNPFINNKIPTLINLTYCDQSDTEQPVKQKPKILLFKSLSENNI